MTLLAAILAALAVALLVPGSSSRPVRRGNDPSDPDAGGRGSGLRLDRGLVVVVAGVAATVLVGLDGTRLALALILLGCAGAARVLVRRSRQARAAERRQVRVVELCEALVGELRAGQPLVSSLERCGEAWPELAPVVAAGRLGADVPAALRRLASRPGAEGLRETAAAWQVAQHSGAGLAAALGQVADTARERQGARHLVQGELASAQATARLVAVLPLASLAMSAGIGGDPWQFLLGTPVGLACLAAGAVLAFAGLLWIDRIAAAVLRGDPG
jgi:tight adherence protein B